MKPLRFVVVKSRSMRDLFSLRMLNRNGQPVLFSLQDELTKAGYREGDTVELKVIGRSPCSSPGGDRLGHACSKCVPTKEDP